MQKGNRAKLLCNGTGNGRNRDIATVEGEEKKNEKAVDPDL